MARYRRARYRRRRLGRRRRRYGKRKMLQRRRKLTVRYNVDYPLQAASYVPVVDTEVPFGTKVGVPINSFETWCINPLPLSLIYPLGGCGAFGTTAAQQRTRQFGGAAVGNTTTQYNKTITDIPVVIGNDNVYDTVYANTMFRLCKEYRIAWVSVTLTLPENTAGQPNRHLFIEWTNMPHATAATPVDVRNWICPTGATNDSIDAGRDIPDDAKGWNWICNPLDVATACSIPAKSSGKHGWQRAMLTSANPVTISWRPRHANIKFDNQLVTDLYVKTNNTFAARVNPVDMYGTKLTRGYLPTRAMHNTEPTLDEENHVWLGPIIRLVDTDKPIQLATKYQSSQGDQTLSDLYNIRCNLSMCVKFRKMQANDPYFPQIAPVNTQRWDPIVAGSSTAPDIPLVQPPSSKRSKNNNLTHRDIYTPSGTFKPNKSVGVKVTTAIKKAAEGYKRNYDNALSLMNKLGARGMLPPEAYPMLALANFGRGNWDNFIKYRSWNKKALTNGPSRLLLTR